MLGLMQDRPLVLTHFFDRAERLFPDKGIVTATGPGLERTTYGDWADRTRRLGGVLDQLGISADGRVATFAWNTASHLELYFAAPCTGRVLHTLNIRLFPEQVTYIVNHAEDEVIFVDKSLARLLWPLLDTFTTVRHIVVMDDGGGDSPLTRGVPVHDYEDAARRGRARSSSASTTRTGPRRCATRRGTTGNPKGVVYSHRSTWLHTHGGDDGRQPRRLRARRDPAGRAHVPCQRLGPRPCRRGVRRQPGDARPPIVAAGARRR